MLEVVALGLRSGLTFDRSFALYGEHFDNDFAQSCARAHRSWALGLVSREEALRELASSYGCEQLSRVVDSVVRSLRFGSSLTGILEEAAAQSRAEWRTALEERVAKAPVKMMLPTGTLILPAMLLLVMGPILLELAGGF
jgi:tight adherence protein C